MRHRAPVPLDLLRPSVLPLQRRLALTRPTGLGYVSDRRHATLRQGPDSSPREPEPTYKVSLAESRAIAGGLREPKPSLGVSLDQTEGAGLGHQGVEEEDQGDPGEDTDKSVYTVHHRYSKGDRDKRHTTDTEVYHATEAGASRSTRKSEGTPTGNRGMRRGR